MNRKSDTSKERKMPGQVRDSCESLLRPMVGFDTVNSTISGKPVSELARSQYLESQANAMGLTIRRLPVSGEGFNLLVSHRVSDELEQLRRSVDEYLNLMCSPIEAGKGEKQ